MTAATITQAPAKGLRQQLSALAASLRGFATGLFAAHGGWMENRARLAALARSAESHSPSLSVELRFLASRG